MLAIHAYTVHLNIMITSAASEHFVSAESSVDLEISTNSEVQRVPKIVTNPFQICLLYESIVKIKLTI